jgi:hypothetical protein
MTHDQRKKHYPVQPDSDATQAPRHNPDDCHRGNVFLSNEQKAPDTDDDGKGLTGPQHIEASAR